MNCDDARVTSAMISILHPGDDNCPTFVLKVCLHFNSVPFISFDDITQHKNVCTSAYA